MSVCYSSELDFNFPREEYIARKSNSFYLTVTFFHLYNRNVLFCNQKKIQYIIDSALIGVLPENQIAFY